MSNPKTITERLVVPVTIKINYEDRPGARESALRDAMGLFKHNGIYGASVDHGGYSLEVASVGKPKAQRRRAKP